MKQIFYLLTSLAVTAFSLADARAATIPACPTIPHPAANAVLVSGTTAFALAAINTARGIESASLVSIESQLPADYATMTTDQKVVVLINAERTARGIPALNAAIQGQNDPYISNIMANHSLLIALNPTWWSFGIVHENAVDGTLGSRETAPSGPPGLVAAGLGEIIAAGPPPESEVWNWMYGDLGSAWGHRDNILNCTWQFMGAGVAVAPPNSAVFGAGSLVTTVDFVNPGATSTYVQALPATPRPCQTFEVPAPRFTCPRNQTPTIFSDLPGGGLLSLSADGKSINISVNISVLPLYNAPNTVKAYYVFQSANWGSPSGAIPSLGAPPQGTGAFSCPLVPVLHTALDPTDPAAADPTSVTSRCVATIPFTGNPVTAAVVDQFNNLLYFTYNLTPPL